MSDKVRGPMGYDRVPFIGNHGQTVKACRFNERRFR